MKLPVRVIDIGHWPFTDGLCSVVELQWKICGHEDKFFKRQTLVSEPYPLPKEVVAHIVEQLWEKVYEVTASA